MKFLQKGFGFIEMLIAIVIVAIAATILFPQNKEPMQHTYQVPVEQRCIAGYLHTVARQTTVQQILNENGGGIPCQ
jgi:prepilin-type N-terminal cleavage/methylation domain-containing protein